MLVADRNPGFNVYGLARPHGEEREKSKLSFVGKFMNNTQKAKFMAKLN